MGIKKFPPSKRRLSGQGLLLKRTALIALSTWQKTRVWSAKWRKDWIYSLLTSKHLQAQPGASCSCPVSYVNKTGERFLFVIHGWKLLFLVAGFISTWVWVLPSASSHIQSFPSSCPCRVWQWTMSSSPPIIRSKHHSKDKSPFWSVSVYSQSFSSDSFRMLLWTSLQAPLQNCSCICSWIPILIQRLSQH